MSKNFADPEIKSSIQSPSQEGENQSRHQALIDEITSLKLAEEGAKEAFGAVVTQKRLLEAKVKHLEHLLRDAHEIIRKHVKSDTV